MIGGFGEIKDPPLGDGPDKPFTHAQPGHMDRFLAQAVRGEQLQLIVAQQIDRADFAAHRLGDEVDDAIELGLGRSALGHDAMEACEDLAGGSGGGQRHPAGLSEGARRCQPVDGARD